MREKSSPTTSTLAAIEAVAGADDLFAGLDADARLSVEQETSWTTLQSGEVLFREGDAGDALYVVLTGRLRVVVRGTSGEEVALAEVGRGEVIGEMALLTGDPRSATVVAVRDSHLVRLSRAAFERIVQQCPGAMLLVTRRLVRRLQQANRGPRGVAPLATIALVPLDPSVESTALGHTLVDALATFGTATLVTRARVEAEVGRGASSPDGDEAPLATWLDGLERDYRFIVYAGDANAMGWTVRSARQADRLLLVADGDREPAAAAAEAVRRLAALPARRDLMLLHASPAPPTRTSQWLELSGARAHYHVRLHQPADVARLARLLTGRGIGLVLGGGGARGFAHLGVIQALQEAGVPIDAVGGTSMGAVIAAQLATGADLAQLRELNRRHWVKQNPLKDKTLPVVALLAGRRLDRMIEAMFADWQIEDLGTTFFCVSADLTRAEMRVHDRGALGRAVRASMSLPGIAIPVHDAGSMLVDGGLLNNLPADVMRGMCGKVIAVDVSPAKDLVIAAPYPPAASGWRLLWGRRASNLPGIGAILMRSVMLSSTRHQTSIAREVDLFLHPSVESFGMFEWNAIDGIADAGYRFTREALASGGFSAV
jgi:predicted acylesterase/phospholipase RssA/CRP-like cAMP-binding protein